MRDHFHPGQRWISESEPELGLGVIAALTERTVTVEFRASAERRQYARANAPLRRVRFRPDDRIRTQDGATINVQSTQERGGLLFYESDGREICESELHD